jgi:MFS family permease
MVYYLNRDLAVGGAVAGLVASLVTVVPIFTALWGGRVYDSMSRHRIVMVLALLGSAGSLALAASPSLYASVACSALGGVVSGFGYTFAFAGARDLNKVGVEYDSLAIAWVNSISLTGSFLPSVFFSYVTALFGYSQAWLWSSLLTLAFLPPVLLMVERWGR